MRGEIANAIRLIESGDATNVEMALYALQPFANGIMNDARFGHAYDVEAIIHVLMKQAFRKYLNAFGIYVREHEKTKSVIRLETRAGNLDYCTQRGSLLFAILSHPSNWKEFIHGEVMQAISKIVEDPMNNNDWKP